MLGDPAALSRGVLVERRAQLLAGLPGDVDLVVAFVGSDRAGQSGLLALGEVLSAAAQDGPDPVQRSPARPRWPRLSCWTRRLTSSTA